MMRDIGSSSLQDNSVDADSEKQTQMQGKEVKKEKKKKEEEEEEMQNQTPEQENQGPDGVYPWLQKLTATCTRFIIIV